MTEEEEKSAAAATAEAEAKADAEAAEAAKQKDAEYWKAEAKKAFEARDSAKEEARMARQQATPVVEAPAQEDLNELYWQKPAEVVERLVAKHVEPFYEDKYESQKRTLVSKDPNYEKYFPQIDAMVKAQPELKKQPGIVEKLYKVASAMEFDEPAVRKQIEERIRSEMQNKVLSSVEGAGAGKPDGSPSLPTLSAEQKQFAERFHSDLSPQEAHKKYAEAKAKHDKGAY